MTQFLSLLVLATAIVSTGCATIPSGDAKPELAKADGYFVSQKDALARTGVANYVFRSELKHKTAAPALAPVAKAPATEKIQVVQAAPVATPSTSVYFEVNKYNLSNAARAELKKIARASHGGKIAVVGSADQTGGRALNARLSQRRAQAVKSYLVSALKVPASKIQTKALGAVKNENYAAARNASVMIK